MCRAEARFGLLAEWNASYSTQPGCKLLVPNPLFASFIFPVQTKDCNLNGQSFLSLPNLRSPPPSGHDSTAKPVRTQNPEHVEARVRRLSGSKSWSWDHTEFAAWGGLRAESTDRRSRVVHKKPGTILIFAHSLAMASASLGNSFSTRVLKSSFTDSSCKMPGRRWRLRQALSVDDPPGTRTPSGGCPRGSFFYHCFSAW